MKTLQVAKLIGVNPDQLYTVLAKRGSELPRNKSNRQYIWTDEAIAIARSWFHGPVKLPDNDVYPALIKSDASIELMGAMTVTPVDEQPNPLHGKAIDHIRLANYIMSCVVDGPDNSSDRMRAINDTIDILSQLFGMTERIGKVSAS